MLIFLEDRRASFTGLNGPCFLIFYGFIADVISVADDTYMQEQDTSVDPRRNLGSVIVMAAAIYPCGLAAAL